MTLCVLCSATIMATRRTKHLNTLVEHDPDDRATSKHMFASCYKSQSDAHVSQGQEAHSVHASNAFGDGQGTAWSYSGAKHTAEKSMGIFASNPLVRTRRGHIQMPSAQCMALRSWIDPLSELDECCAQVAWNLMESHPWINRNLVIQCQCLT